ncbi:hypothetical protein Undi14_14335 [Undibacterium sp. 14-3-2]|uniref:hypothetical protein n=1 Tax=Undibacterium sp. 14-3-2 TaxID=2800129 RepID=UPI001904491A|nr:hypothetical protein [Undibacterium sp. 14-3-2]MBK1891214.1 hypothetical protein [Undibacterium sp. 14-3-2]
MLRIAKIATALAVPVLMAACAHPITLKSNLDKISTVQASQKIDKSVGYYIDPASLNTEVTTGGGGGDKVKYSPYQDIEPGFYKVLSNVFKDVNRLKSPQEKELITKYDISLIFTPLILTNSSSPSPFTWPPTKFTTELTCKITDKNGQLVVEKKVVGDGAAEFEEFKLDHSLSARRSTEDLLQKLQKVLLETPELRK